MPHLRTRHIEAILRSLLGHSPIVGLFGHRQVGKTTLVSQLAKSYVTLDRRADLALLRENPDGFVSHRESPFAIDEAQIEPLLFPALKEAVRTNRRPGQFIITGSVRFSSRKQIRESLTGRIIAWELLPMDLPEIHGQQVSDHLLKLSNSRTLDFDLGSRKKTFTSKDYYQYLKHGGLPGLFSIRNEVARLQKMELQIETLLERDLRMIVETKLNYDSLRRLIGELANRQLEPFEIYPLARATQISVPTLMGLMRAFEAMYLIRWIPSIGSSVKKSFIFEDQGEASYLQTRPVSELHDFVRFLYANLRGQWFTQNRFKVQVAQMRIRSGQWIPWVLKGLGTRELAIIPVLDSEPSASAMGAASSFLKRHTQGRVLLVHQNPAVDRVIHPQIRLLPWMKLV